MFSSISWTQYFIFLLIAGIIYYLFIWIAFFKAKLPALSGIASFRTSLHQEDDISATARHIMDELAPVFNTKNKAELMMALQVKLKRYSAWDEPGFREAINQYIASESESSCSIRLSDLDLRAVWS